jgi:uncharacterized protein (TIGR00730 family)
MTSNFQSITEDQYKFLKVIEEEYIASYELMNSMPNLTLVMYGGTKLEEDSKTYKELVSIAHTLSDKGWGMVSGGGPGAMKAAIVGGNMGKTPTTAIKVDIKKEKSPKIAEHEFLFTNFAPRKFALRQSDVYMFVPGGFGTFDEFFEIVTLQKVDMIPIKPVILYNKEFWDGMLKWLTDTVLKENFITKEELDSWIILDSPEEVIAFLDEEAKKKTK